MWVSEGVVLIRGRALIRANMVDILNLEVCRMNFEHLVHNVPKIGPLLQ